MSTSSMGSLLFSDYMCIMDLKRDHFVRKNAFIAEQDISYGGTSCVEILNGI